MTASLRHKEMPTVVVYSPHWRPGITWWKDNILATAFWSNYYKHDTQRSLVTLRKKKEIRKDRSLLKHIQTPSTRRHLIRNDSR